MFRNSWLKSILVPLAAIIALGAMACLRAEAQVVPFKIKGGGPAPLGLNLAGVFAPHSATGNATHLGNYSGNGSAQVTAFNGMNGTFHGSFVFVAANGDKLACDYGGPAFPAPAPGDPGTFSIIDANQNGIVVQFYANFTPNPALSTGRFANVIGGSFFMVATTSRFLPIISPQGYTPPFDYTWTGDGSLEFKKGK